MGRALLAVCATALGLVAAPAARPPARVLPDCAGHPQVEPPRVVFACGDGNFGFDRLQWIGWGGARAVGLGSAYLNDCRPDCAAGHFARYGAVLIASGAQRCPRGQRAYLTVT
jgi:hypothetical protein